MNIERNRLYEVHELTALLPGRPSRNAVYRWIRKGVKGTDGQRVRLRRTRVGGVICVSGQAVLDFIEDQNREPEPARRRSAAERKRASAGARDELRKMGV